MPLQATLNRLQNKVIERARERAQELQDITVELHVTAPRGGSYLNSLGQFRSAPGEPPAVEFGDLTARLQEPVQREGDAFSTIVNYKVLEAGTFGGQRIAPRPMGHLAVQQLKARVRSGSR